MEEIQEKERETQKKTSRLDFELLMSSTGLFLYILWEFNYVTATE